MALSILLPAKKLVELRKEANYRYVADSDDTEGKNDTRRRPIDVRLDITDRLDNLKPKISPLPTKDSVLRGFAPRRQSFVNSFTMS